VAQVVYTRDMSFESPNHECKILTNFLLFKTARRTSLYSSSL